MNVDYCSDFVENQSRLWYDHPQFKAYCHNYSEMKKWICTYKSYLTAQPTNEYNLSNAMWAWRSTDSDFSTDMSSLSPWSDDDDDSYEMIISDEMLAFLETSEKHRQELKMQRKEEEKETYQLPSEKLIRKEHNINRFQPPAARPGTQRTAEMKLLYGKCAAMIHGMETAMQLSFDHNCDVYQPKLWPNIPLKM